MIEDLLTCWPNFAYAFEECGPIQQVGTAEPDELREIGKRLPRPLLELIRDAGYCRFYGGAFTMVDPIKMRPLTAQIFGADPTFSHSDCHMLGYTAFGNCIFWSNKIYDFNVDMPLGRVFSLSLTRPDFVATASVDHIASGFIPFRQECDFYDYTGQLMLDRCIEAYGPPAPGEMYGFVPALSVAGEWSPFQRVENIKRVSAPEHLSILAQMGPRYLMKTVPGGIEPVRKIG